MSDTTRKCNQLSRTAARIFQFETSPRRGDRCLFSSERRLNQTEYVRPHQKYLVEKRINIKIIGPMTTCILSFWASMSFVFCKRLWVHWDGVECTEQVSIALNVFYANRCYTPDTVQKPCKNQHNSTLVEPTRMVKQRNRSLSLSLSLSLALSL